MKGKHFFIGFISAFLFLGSLFIYSISSSSSAPVQCNPERLNQVNEFSVSAYGLKNISGVFLVPAEYPYAKLYTIFNASFLAECGVVNSNCDYYVNGMHCGSVATNLTSALNTSGGKKFYPISCLNSIKAGTNVLTLNVNGSGSGSIQNVFVEMEFMPANC